MTDENQGYEHHYAAFNTKHTGEIDVGFTYVRHRFY